MTEPREIYLKPAEMVLCKKPCRVTTVLGSCLTVVLYHALSRTGAICHALLPHCQDSAPGCHRGCQQAMRYVDCSLRFMLEQYATMGISPGALKVKLFGGADMFGSKSQQSISSVGKQNVEMAMNLVQKMNLRLTAYNLGGTLGRKLFFHSHTGDVEMKFSNEAEQPLSRSIFLEQLQLLNAEAK